MTILEEEIRAARNKYQNEWRRKNKEKVRQYNKSYWERKARESQSQKVGAINVITTNENN